jgi:hypothetical protein
MTGQCSHVSLTCRKAQCNLQADLLQAFSRIFRATGNRRYGQPWELKPRLLCATRNRKDLSDRCRKRFKLPQSMMNMSVSERKSA